MEVCELDAMVPGQLHGLLGPGLQLLDPSVCLGAVCVPHSALNLAAALALNIACLFHASTTSDVPAIVAPTHARLTIDEPDRSPLMTFSWVPIEWTAR